MVQEPSPAEGWPDFEQAFTAAAIDTLGAQLHPEVFTQDRLERLPDYLRPTFQVEEDRRHGHGSSHKGHGHPKVLGRSKSLTDLQRSLAGQARQSARSRVDSQATKAARQGQVVKSVDLLHQSGATTKPREELIWQAALDKLRLPAQRISSRWLSREALMLASAPYPDTSALAEDLQMAAVKRLIPHTEAVTDDRTLQEAVASVSQVYEDTVYQVAKDVVAVLETSAKVDKAVSGPADLPLLSVLQWIRQHSAGLIAKGFIGVDPPYALPRLRTYLEADLMRLDKARRDKDRDVRWAWQAQTAQDLVDHAVKAAQALPAGPGRDNAMDRARKGRWMMEEYFVSIWAQELGTAIPVSLQRIRKALEGKP